ncbi:tetratricopeptide repeat protein [Archangium sp.]|uniref:tetratricopeptide repeat protein n=1 Tax=Archangium sp. TaxID=1872627 RepID=UPI00389AC0F0
MLTLVAMLVAADPLAEAKQSFAAGQYTEAEQQALQAAQPPRLGAALYLVGLARFRAGRPAEALEALEAAGRAEDAPPRASWSFNRGACLYALERFAEAEQAFLEATADEALARVAWVNAGFAALDAGAPERAAQWAERAKPGASEREAAQVEELLALAARARGSSEDAEAPREEAYTRGLAAFDAGRFEEARTLFLQDAKRDPDSGRARLMAGASAYRLGEREMAREDVTAALSLQLEPQDRRTAHDYLDRLSFGLRASGQGFQVSAGAGAGFDSNVLQVGVAARDVSTSARTASTFAEAGLGLGARFRLSDALFADLSYGGTQRAYATSAAEDYSLQLHRAAVAVEWESAHRFRLGLASWGDVFFTGLSDFRGLQASLTGSAWLALDESEHTSTRLDVSLARKAGLGSEFSYLSGRRLDATLSQELRFRLLAMTAWYRYREDRIGTLVQSASVVTTGTTQEYVIPFAWTGHAGGASARMVLGERFDAGLDAEAEWRHYLSDSSLRVQAADGSTEEWNLRRRADVRFALVPTVSARLSKHLRLSARYELLVNTSNVDTRLADAAGTCTAPDYLCHRYDYTNGNYQKHLVMLELGATW